MTIEISGTVHAIGETQTISDTFTKRELVLSIMDNPKFPPQLVPVEFVKDRAEALSGFKIGDEVVIQANVRGREWQSREGVTKYFLSLDGWRIALRRQTQPGQIPPTQPRAKPSDDTDIPF